MKRLFVYLLIVSLCVSLCGCFLDPAEQLYAVPKQSDSFYNLQKKIEAVMAEDDAYSPPVNGENQQAVQMADLDGDKEDEAIVYLKTSGDKPLCICVFDKKEESYELAARIDGVGNAFDQVQYVKFDDRPGNEIVVGRRISDGVTQVLSVLTICDGTLIELLNTPYYEFITADLDADALRDVLLLHQDSDVQNGIAVYYHWVDGQAVRELEASLSTPVSAIKRIIAGKMCKGVPAVFVASTYNEGLIVTDIFGLRRGVFTNLSKTDETVKTVREYYVYSCDIDNDGLIELPKLIPMPTIDGEEGSSNQALIRWYNLLLSGHEQEKELTYHNYSDGWYLKIPEHWQDKIAVTGLTAFGGTGGCRFVDVKSGQTIFSIVSAANQNVAKNVGRDGWTQLTQKGEITYMAMLSEAAQLYSLDITTLREMFHLIRVDWNTGET